MKNNKIVRQAQETGISETELISQQIRQTGSVSAAARKLQVNVNTLYYWLNKTNKRVKRQVIIEEVK